MLCARVFQKDRKSVADCGESNDAGDPEDFRENLSIHTA